MRTRRQSWVHAWGFSTALACGMAEPIGFAPGQSGGLAGSTSSGVEVGSSSDVALDLGALDTTSSSTTSELQECVAVSVMAELQVQPVDIVFAIATDIMGGIERNSLSDQLAIFSEQIVASGIDAHVVLIELALCVPAPLGSGACPDDDNPPIFTHLREHVHVLYAWDTVLSLHSEWGPLTRPNAATHVVMMSNGEGTMRVGTFDEMFRALDPSYADYVQHAAVCQCVSGSCVGIGTSYVELAEQTGGVVSDLCTDAPFTELFDRLSEELITGSPLACEFAIPSPPDGQELDPGAVNVQFLDGMGGLLEIGAVDDPSACADVVDGWYYDDPASPSTIHVCPQTCETLQTYTAGSIELAFGCRSRPAPPVG